jgi:uncharacterized membrane protein
METSAAQQYVLVPAPQAFQGSIQMPYPQVAGWGPPQGGFGPPFVPPPLILLGILLLFLLVRRTAWARANADGTASEWSLEGAFGFPRRDGLHPDRALYIARERLAGGEITPEEFETIRQGLST